MKISLSGIPFTKAAAELIHLGLGKQDHKEESPPLSAPYEHSQASSEYSTVCVDPSRERPERLCISGNVPSSLKV